MYRSPAVHGALLVADVAVQESLGMFVGGQSIIAIDTLQSVRLAVHASLGLCVCVPNEGLTLSDLAAVKAIRSKVSTRKSTRRIQYSSELKLASRGEFGAKLQCMCMCDAQREASVGLHRVAVNLQAHRTFL